MEKKRKNLTMDPVTTKICEKKSSEEICYLIQIGNSAKQDFEVTELLETLYDDVQELKAIVIALSQLLIERD